MEKATLTFDLVIPEQSDRIFISKLLFKEFLESDDKFGDAITLVGEVYPSDSEEQKMNSINEKIN